MLTKSWLKVWNFLGMKENKEDIKLLLIMVFAEKTSVITLGKETLKGKNDQKVQYCNLNALLPAQMAS